MQVMDPNFNTNRPDLGIHPDGNVAGTEGCIGIKDNDSTDWYDAFYDVPQGHSVSVEVKDVSFRMSDIYDISNVPTQLSVLGDRVATLETRLRELELSDESSKWAVISSHAEEAFEYVKNWVDLRDENGNALGTPAQNRFACIIRAVSWVESKHGTAGANYPARDPMQCGNPGDIWLRTITGQQGDGDRFVRGPNFTGADPNDPTDEGAYWARELPGVFDSDAPNDAKLGYLGNATQQREGHRNALFGSRLSYFWGILYLIHRTNTHPGLGSSRRTYKCGDSSMTRLIDGAVQYNGGGDPAYGDKIRDALNLIGCSSRAHDSFSAVT